MQLANPSHVFSSLDRLAHGSFGSLDEIIATLMLVATALAVVLIYRMPQPQPDDKADANTEAPASEPPSSETR